MRNPESRLWSDLNRMMGVSWVAWRIESKNTNPGISDVYILHPRWRRGWLELKVGNVRKRDHVIVVPHYTDDQRYFLNIQIRGGQMGAVLLRVPELQMHWLLTTARAIELCGMVTAEELNKMCTWMGQHLSREMLNVDGQEAFDRTAVP